MSDLPVLDANDQRILGALLEKQTTVPATYPLTANALRSSCNQLNNRDPVLDLDLQTVEQVARTLKDRGLLRIVWAATGRRTLKYHQILDERLELEVDERALLTVLLLRGEQAPGELRTRTERLHPFADRREVEGCLSRMAARPEPLVRELERRPGQQDGRWIHLLGPAPRPTDHGDGEQVGSSDEPVAIEHAPIGPHRLRTARVLRVDEHDCEVTSGGEVRRVVFAATFPSPRAGRVAPGHLVAVATGPQGDDVAVWRWYDAVVLGREADGAVRLWEPGHGEVRAEARASYSEVAPGSRAYLSSGLPGAEWWVTGSVGIAPEAAAVDLEDVDAFYAAQDWWGRAFDVGG